MDTVKVFGLVIRQVNYGESARVLTIFTRELGIVSAIARGARKFSSHQGSAAQILCSGEFVLAPGKNMYSLRGASGIKSFFSIASDIKKLSLCQYLFDLTQTMLEVENPDEEVFALLMNTLYVLENKDRDIFCIKAVYELRLCTLWGQALQTGSCIKCSSTDSLFAISVADGGVVCTSCSDNECISVSPSVIAAIEYIQFSDMSRIFSFTISGETIKKLGAVSERHALLISDRKFKSLDYFKNI